MQGVIPFSLAVFFNKFFIYSIGLWLPNYLEKDLEFDSSKAANVATSFSVGNFCGGFLLGWLTDLMNGRRTPICMLSIVVGSAVSFLLFSLYKDVTFILLCSCLAVMGLTLGGLFHMLSIACPLDIGAGMQEKGLKGTATVVGIVDAFGSFGSSLGQLVVGYCVDTYGWRYGYLLILCLSSAVIMLPLCWPFVREVREIRGKSD